MENMKKGRQLCFLYISRNSVGIIDGNPLIIFTKCFRILSTEKNN